MRVWKSIILVLFNIILIAGLFYGFEYYLWLRDPFLNLPFDTEYYLRYQKYYEGLDVPEGEYTWGHPVTLNRFGFREREFELPEPEGVCRILVLGDSFTWGKGLAVEERYTNLTENYLNDRFPERKFEVLNLGITGGPTVWERDILRQSFNLDPPDMIVVGFTLNDPQPKPQDYRVEKEQFDQKYGPALESMSRFLIELGLPLTAKLVREAIDNMIVFWGIVPSWEVGLDRTYDKNSPEWQAFVQALSDIKTMSDQLNLPTPIFAVLNQGIFLHYPTDYRSQDEDLPIYVRWAHQAEQAAADLGFRTYNHEEEFLEQLLPHEIPVNQLDQHPSAKVNLIYAQKLSEMLEADVLRGELCPSEHP